MIGGCTVVGVSQGTIGVDGGGADGIVVPTGPLRAELSGIGFLDASGSGVRVGNGVVVAASGGGADGIVTPTGPLRGEASRVGDVMAASVFCFLRGGSLIELFPSVTVRSARTSSAAKEFISVDFVRFYEEETYKKHCIGISDMAP